jgi:transcriptional regulator of acetoin/glycerol metabolism
LFYRLNTVAVTLPPLRARTDLDEVVEQMLGRLDEQAQMNPAALDLLRRQRWPGNFRELRAVLTRALLRCGNHHIEVEDVAHSLGPCGEFSRRTEGSAAAPHAAQAPRSSAAELVARETRRAQRSTGWATRHDHGPHAEAAAPLSAEPAASSALQQGATSAVLAEYQRTGGSVSATSRNLGISRTTVYRHLRLAEVL